MRPAPVAQVPADRGKGSPVVEQLRRGERGMSLVEDALILFFVSLSVVLAMVFLRGDIDALIRTIAR